MTFAAPRKEIDTPLYPHPINTIEKLFDFNDFANSWFSRILLFLRVWMRERSQCFVDDTHLLATMKAFLTEMSKSPKLYRVCEVMLKQLDRQVRLNNHTAKI